jgi:NTE family protein
MRFVTLTVLLIFTIFAIRGQSVGLVLSGGGAAGFAHVGVLKALEERGIPIDFITGTSAGALVGAMYASGMSIQQIEELSMSDDFFLMANGGIQKKHQYFLPKDENNASLIKLNISKDSILQKSLPTSVITPAMFDFQMLRIFGVVGASKNKDFNQLMVPFRCVAADIENKKEVIFRKGDLNHCVRASMTFPFYINPIRIDNVLLFDGGLYNNFPADVMYRDFNPDFIIGSNVSENNLKPYEDDLLSQMRAAMVRETNFEIPCDAGVLIKHSMDVGTFDFNKEKVQLAIQVGYDNTLAYLDSIELYVTRKVSHEELTKKRYDFLKGVKPLKISTVNARFKGGKKANFVNYALNKKMKNDNLNSHQLEQKYYRIYGIPQVRYVLPDITLKEDSSYHLNLYIKKNRELELNVGGHFSSRPVNMGYIGLSYHYINRIAWRAHAESYFGKFYGSARALVDFHVPTKLPFIVTPYFVLNRWDYFRSFATFFEDVRPSFLVQNEMYYGAKIKIPISTTIRASFDYRYVDLSDRYYQTENFTVADTADRTDFYGNTIVLTLEQNSLDRKQFASEGSQILFRARYVIGKERSISGSTAPLPFDDIYNHNWFNLQFEARKYFLKYPIYRFGLHLLGAFNSQSLYRNYVASLLAMTEFAPIPDAGTFFMSEYRAPQYAAVGFNQIFGLYKNVDLRIDTYAFQPIITLRQLDDGGFGYSQYQLLPKFMGSASVIYHSPIGPFRATLNYFPEQTKPFSFLISYGFVIFNERAIR